MTWRANENQENKERKREKREREMSNEQSTMRNTVQFLLYSNQ